MTTPRAVTDDSLLSAPTPSLCLSPGQACFKDKHEIQKIVPSPRIHRNMHVSVSNCLFIYDCVTESAGK